MKRMKWHWSEIMGVFRAATPTHRVLRDRLTSLAVVTVVLDLVLTVAVWLAEREADGTQIHGFGDALFWTTSQLLSVSSSLTAPLTATGRVLDVVAELWAITVVASLAASIGGFLHRRTLERHLESRGVTGSLEDGFETMVRSIQAIERKLEAAE